VSSPPNTPADRYYLFDTGPLLAFAAANGGPTVLKGRYAGRAGIISDVDRELRGLTRSNNQQLAAAAHTATVQYGWLDRHVIDDAPGLRTVQQLQIRLQTFKRPERRIPPTAIDRQDWGECATLLLAERLRKADQQLVIVIANENAGREMAEAVNIPTVCAADILRAAVKDKTLTAGPAFRMYQQMVSKGIDAGDVIHSAAEL
jgi:hypothetical protein